MDDNYKFSGRTCPCPHCRGGHPIEDYDDDYEDDDEEFYADDEHENEQFNEYQNHIAEDSYSEEVEIVRFDTPEVQEHITSLINAYAEGLLEAESHEELEQLLLALYSEVFNYSYGVALREKAFQFLDAVQDMKDKGYIP